MFDFTSEIWLHLFIESLQSKHIQQYLLSAKRDGRKVGALVPNTKMFKIESEGQSKCDNENVWMNLRTSRGPWCVGGSGTYPTPQNWVIDAYWEGERERWDSDEFTTCEANSALLPVCLHHADYHSPPVSSSDWAFGRSGRCCRLTMSSTTALRCFLHWAVLGA